MRWQSDTIVCYLHTTAKSFTEVLSAGMIEHGTYALIPPAHAGNWFQAAHKESKGPFSKGFWVPGT